MSSDTSTSLSIEHTTTPAAVLLTATGEIDGATAPQLAQQLQDAFTRVRAPVPLVIDLTAVKFLSSAGLSILLAAHEQCADAGIPLRIVTTSHAVLRPIQVTGLDTVLTVVDTLAQATQPPA